MELRNSSSLRCSSGLSASITADLTNTRRLFFSSSSFFLTRNLEELQPRANLKMSASMTYPVNHHRYCRVCCLHFVSPPRVCCIACQNKALSKRMLDVGIAGAGEQSRVAETIVEQWVSYEYQISPIPFQTIGVARALTLRLTARIRKCAVARRPSSGLGLAACFQIIRYTNHLRATLWAEHLARFTRHLLSSLDSSTITPRLEEPNAKRRVLFQVIPGTFEKPI